MKKIVILFILAFSFSTLYSQAPSPSKPDAELTQEEAEFRIQEWRKKIQELNEKLKTTDAALEDVKAKLEAQKKALQDCLDEMKRLLGTNELGGEITDQDIENFRQRLGKLEGKVRYMENNYNNDQLAERRDEVAALEDELNQLRKNKIVLIPEFYHKVVDLAKRIRALYREKKIEEYTVGTWAENRDCLWNIAGKIDIYGDPFLWPKIWVENIDKIRNPDIIHPGQVLVLPKKGPKTDEEKKKERQYWRKKRAQMEAQAQEEGAKGE